MLKDKWQGSTWSAQADASLTRKNTGTRRRRHQASPSRRPMLHELCCMRLWLCFICCVLWMSVKDGRSWQIFLMIYISFYSWLFDLWPECLKERNGKISIFPCCLLLWSGRIEECWFRAEVVLHDWSCMMRAKLLLGKNCPGRWHTRVSTRSLTEYNSNNVILIVLVHLEPSDPFCNVHITEQFSRKQQGSDSRVKSITTPSPKNNFTYTHYKHV
jgi:hypothetical protein